METGEERRNLQEPENAEPVDDATNTDKVFTRRRIITLLLFWSFVGLGWMTGQIGPSFPDLQLVVQESLDTASWLFTIYSFGYMAGSLGGGLLFDHFNRPLVIALATLILAATTLSLPWCQWFSLMLVVRFISGLGAGALDTGANAYVMSYWGEKARPYMQVLHFCFSVGGILSPLATEPFLAQRSCQHVNATGSSGNQSHTNATSIDIDTHNVTESECQFPNFGETQIHIAYLISFVVIFTSSVPFFVIYVKEILKAFRTPSEAESNKEEKKDEKEPANPANLSKKKQIVIIILICLFMMVYCAVEDTFSSFLATFCIRYFDWSKATSSYATSLFWFSFALGRFVAIFIVRMFKPVTLLLSYSSLLIIAFLGVLLACLTSITNFMGIYMCCWIFNVSYISKCVFLNRGEYTSGHR